MLFGTKKKVTALIMAICILLTTVITVRHTGIKSEASSTSTIKEYQRYLNNNYGANLKVDGYYGCQSAKATVVALQKIYNKVYGAVSNLTTIVYPDNKKYIMSYDKLNRVISRVTYDLTTEEELDKEVFSYDAACNIR